MTKNQTILVVEDDTPLRSVLSSKLTKEGFVVLEAKNGKEGLKIALSDHPSLILLDMIMPIMDGMTMLKHLRADEWGKKAKVIILTNVNDSEKVTEAVAHGSHDYLVKADWKIEDVVKKVRDKLKNK